MYPDVFTLENVFIVAAVIIGAVLLLRALK